MKKVKHPTAFRINFVTHQRVTTCTIQTQVRGLTIAESGTTVCHPQDKPDFRIGRKNAFRQAMHRIGWQLFELGFPLTRQYKKLLDGRFRLVNGIAEQGEDRMVIGGVMVDRQWSFVVFTHTERGEG